MEEHSLCVMLLQFLINNNNQINNKNNFYVLDIHYYMLF